MLISSCKPACSNNKHIASSRQKPCNEMRTRRTAAAAEEQPEEPQVEPVVSNSSDSDDDEAPEEATFEASKKVGKPWHGAGMHCSRSGLQALRLCI